MTRVCSFAPVSRADAAVLILGSMPGVASLRAGQYYAHPRNQFWPILGALVGARPELPYRARLRALVAARIALWDVLKSCTRPGSLDTAIDGRTVLVNDFESFFAAHRRIERVCFNGSAAEALFRRHVRPPDAAPQLALVRLPSTSPAHAGMTFARKLAAWRAACAPAARGSGSSAGR